MNTWAHRTMHLVGSVVLLAFVASGCRSYGGYGSEEDLAAKIQQAVERFATDFERAQGERDALQRAAAANPALAEVAERFAGVVAQQEAMVEKHRMLAEEAATQGSGNILFDWVGPDTYRMLHRAYGAVISDQQIIEDRYGEVLQALEYAVGGTMAPMAEEVSRYHVAPQFYERIAASGEAGSVAEILTQGASASAAPAPDSVSVATAPASE